MIVTMLILVHFRWLREMLWQLLEPLRICHGSVSDISCIMLECVCVVLCSVKHIFHLVFEVFSCCVL